jgi:hypothetical protein
VEHGPRRPAAPHGPARARPARCRAAPRGTHPRGRQPPAVRGCCTA